MVTEQDKALGKRIRRMERIEREQRRFAARHLILTRSLLGASLLVIILVGGLLAGRLPTVMLSLSWAVMFAAWIVIVTYVIVRK